MRAEPSSYDKTARPECGDGSPTVVEVQFMLTQVNKINERLGLISVNGFLRTWWRDPRLAFNRTVDGGCADLVTLTEGESASLWRPELMIYNEASAEKKDVRSFTEVSSDGVVFRSEQVTTDVKSGLDLARLPYDSHVAKVDVVSHGQDSRSVRLVPRHGAVDAAGATGVGLVASPMKSNGWHYTDDAEEHGFETPGSCEKKEVFGARTWDYCRLTFPLSRKPRYYIIQVLLPCMTFLLVGYMQFFVAPASAPARAALATIPLLIMRTFSNHIYSTLPQGSQQMWLADVLNGYTGLCAVAAVEFGLVQFLLGKEHSRKMKHEGLRNVESKVRLLISHSKSNEVSLNDLLQICNSIHRDTPMVTRSAISSALHEGHSVPIAGLSSVGVAPSCISHGPSSTSPGVSTEEPGTDSAAGGVHTSAPISQFQELEAGGGAASLPEVIRTATQMSLALHVKESDTFFLRYALHVFSKYDMNRTGMLCAPEIRKACRHYNIYASEHQLDRVMRAYFCDIGEPALSRDAIVRLDFAQFCGFLLDIDEYLMLAERRTTMGFLQSLPPSLCVDVIFRWSYPVLFVLMQSLFYAVLVAY